MKHLRAFLESAETDESAPLSAPLRLNIQALLVDLDGPTGVVNSVQSGELGHSIVKDDSRSKSTPNIDRSSRPQLEHNSALRNGVLEELERHIRFEDDAEKRKRVPDIDERVKKKKRRKSSTAEDENH